MSVKEQFQSRESIPELVPEVLWLPRERTDLHPPHAEAHTARTTTPREVGYALFTGSFDASFENQVLETIEKNSDLPKSLRRENLTLAGEIDGLGNHMARAILKAVTDPERLAPIDMVEVYKNELALARAAYPGEERFFENFVEDHGVLLEREQQHD